MSNKEKLVLTAAAAAVGVIVGLLLAPEKGSDLRKSVSKKGKGIADSLSGAYDTVSHKINGLRRDAEEIQDETRDKVRKTTNQILS